MIHKHPFDEQVKKQLEGYSPAVPPHIWENINNKKDKKRPFFYLFDLRGKGLALLMMVLTAGSIGTYLFISANSPYKTHTSSVVKLSKNNQAAKATAHSEPVKHPETTATEKTTNIQLAGAVVSEKNSSNHPISAIKNKNSEMVSTITETATNNNESRISLKSNEKYTFSKNNAASLHTKNKKIKNLAIDQSVDKPLIYKRLKRKSTLNNSEEEYSALTAVSSLDEQELLSKPVQKMGLIERSSNFSPKLKINNKTSPGIPCPNNNKAVNKNYLDFYASADYVLRQFNDTPNSNYLVSRKESTSFSSAFSFGLRYTCVFGNGLNLRAGLNYSQINEKFSFVQGNIIQDIFIINTNGDTIGSYQTVSTRYKTSYNRYKTLDIPITVGYEVNRGKWDFNINTGIMVNIHSWNSGAVLNESLQPVAIGNKDSNSPYKFKSNIGIGGLGAVSCYYKLGEHLKVFGEPYLRYNFSTINKADISLKQKYHTSGVKFGFRIEL